MVSHKLFRDFDSVIRDLDQEFTTKLPKSNLKEFDSFVQDRKDELRAIRESNLSIACQTLCDLTLSEWEKFEKEMRDLLFDE